MNKNTFNGFFIRYSTSSEWGCVKGWCIVSNKFVLVLNENKGKSVTHNNSFLIVRIFSPLFSKKFVNSRRTFPNNDCYNFEYDGNIYIYIYIIIEY